MNDPRIYSIDHLRMVEANQRQPNALMNSDAARSRDALKSSLLALHNLRSFQNVGAPPLAPTAMDVLLHRLVEKSGIYPSINVPLENSGGLTFDAKRNNIHMSRPDPLSTLCDTGALVLRNPEFHNKMTIENGDDQRGKFDSCARPMMPSDSVDSKRAIKACFPLPKAKAVPFKKPQLLSFRKLWSELETRPSMMRKEMFSRQLYHNRGSIHIQGRSIRSVIRPSNQQVKK